MFVTEDTEDRPPSQIIVFNDLQPSKRWTGWPPAAPAQSSYEPMTLKISFTNSRTNVA